MESNDADRSIWLEEIDGAAARAWVERQNEATLALLRHGSFEDDRRAALKILTAEDRIARVEQRGDFLYNFWVDDRHPRGIWRRTTLCSYKTASPDWDILLDLDAICATESESWVWRICMTLPPAHERGLVMLSRGGADACVIREFDLNTRRFLDDGFALPEAKTFPTWKDIDSVYVGMPTETEKTMSGYPRVIRLWRRGQAIDTAEVVFEGSETDVWVYADHDHRAARTTFTRAIDFWNVERSIKLDGALTRRLDIPHDAAYGLSGNNLTLQLRSEWLGYPVGVLLTIELDAFVSGDRTFAEVFLPSTRRILTDWLTFDDHIVLSILDNLNSSIMTAAREDGWRLRPLDGLPHGATLLANRLNSDAETNDFVVWTTGFLTPSTMFVGRPGEPLEWVKAAPHQFDTAGLTVTRHEALATDGTRVPYFQVGPVDARGARVLMTAYGGFEAPVLPSYVPLVGKLWLERGNVYVVAAIRGGGEFGPEWHKAGQREGKRVSHDDFAAVAADLIQRGVTDPTRLAAQGASNGGLLVGNMLTRYPDHFGAIVCGAPLLDMERYTKLLAGASWIAEYGDPDNPDDWAFLKSFSPYHLLQRGQTYPNVLFETTGRDDRVHPGHARKMVDRMQTLGCDALLFEQVEGGHSDGADPAQKAFRIALIYSFLQKSLQSSASF